MKLLIILALLGGIYAASLFNTTREVDSMESKASTELREISQRVKAQKEARAVRESFQARVKKVESILNGTPMAEAAVDFVRCGDRYGVNPSLLLAIAQHESNYGTKGYAVGTNNAFGWGVHSHITFNSWAEGTCAVAEGLAKNYDMSSIEKILNVYAPKSENDTNGYVAHVERYIAANPI